jgi:hypothetical protein
MTFNCTAPSLHLVHDHRWLCGMCVCAHSYLMIAISISALYLLSMFVLAINYLRYSLQCVLNLLQVSRALSFLDNLALCLYMLTMNTHTAQHINAESCNATRRILFFPALALFLVINFSRVRSSAMPAIDSDIEILICIKCVLCRVRAAISRKKLCYFHSTSHCDEHDDDGYDDDGVQHKKGV